ncbi:MAG: DUF4474 domain-containing protein [Oscillospiraceae bacterium]|nr:DUF4474 domain-containing protein [Oscillospiraceae bacterium]
MKSTLFKILAAVLAVSMMVCTFASCKSNSDGGEDITKPPSVEAPVDNDVLVDFGDFGDDPDVTEAPTEPTTAEEPTTSTPPVTPTSPVGGSTGSGSGSSGNSGSTGSSGNTGTVAPSTTLPTSSTGLSQEDLYTILEAAGYEYDEEQQVFYSTLNPWQRGFGFGDVYDQAAVLANMRYITIKIDFVYQGLLWRIQCWKGQYGVLNGGEMGVYTKNPDDTTDFYECASDENLLEMHFKFYKTTNDFNKKRPLFERQLQEHWWLTGFKMGYCDPARTVMEMTLIARDKVMADGIEEGLKNVTDRSGKPNGFKQYTSTSKGTDFYIRQDNTFKIIWVSAGYPNYN